MARLLATLWKTLGIHSEPDVAATAIRGQTSEFANGRNCSGIQTELTKTANGTAPAPDPSGGLLAKYRGQAKHFDEMLAPDGSVRPHWQPVLASLASAGASRANSVTERIQRRIVENGLTLDSFSDPDRAAQPWRLGLVPFVISEADFAFLERAVTQRLQVYEALLADLYGPQTVFAEGLVPPELIFSDPSFLRPLHGIQHTAPRLTFMAVDLARDMTGQWRIIDTHAETLAGQGYALANRVVLADISSKLFRDCNAKRISGFYREIASELVSRSATSEPSIAILGPSPNHETYLSHAYMARYLGYLLLEGSDLSVVGDRVFHKTLAGLQPIDLLVRGVEGAKVDPLELDPNGFAGPPGMVQAVRRHPSLIANSLGTALVENRGLAPFLPQLANHLIGAPLLIPDANRLWLGDPESREALRKNQDCMVRSAFEATARPGHAAVARRLGDLEPAERQALLSEIDINGACYVAESDYQFATAPAWTEEGLVPRATAIRLFVAACGGNQIVMPGGLAMAVDDVHSAGLTSANFQSSDIWVASSQPQGPHYSRWRISEEEAQVQRLGARLPSRVADNLFWLGRYVERADWTLRVMRNALNRGDEDLRPVRRTDAAENAIGMIESKAGTQTAGPDQPDQTFHSLEDRVEELFSSTQNPYAIKTTFINIRRLAGQTRDRLSFDAWRLLNELSAGDPPAPLGSDASELTERLNQRIAELAAFNGLMHENMTRNFGWRFMDLGRRLERANQLAELLRRILVPVSSDNDETERLAFLLETADSFMTYRSRYRFAPTFPLVLDLLLVDETNPRSVAFQLVRVADHMAEMPQASVDAVRTPEQRLALDALTQVRLVDIDKLRIVDGDGRRADLAAMLDRLIALLPELSDTISRRYFSLTEEQPQRVHTRLLP